MRPKEGKPCRELGSRIALAVARELKANFLDEAVREAVSSRLENREDFQMSDEDRLYCDLLSSMPKKSGAFKPDAMSQILGKDLQQIWLDHLWALSMLQHPAQPWQWAKFVLVHPAKNPSYARAAERYSKLLSDPTTFEVRTIESLLDARALPAATVAAFKSRYLWQVPYDIPCVG